MYFSDPTIVDANIPDFSLFPDFVTENKTPLIINFVCQSKSSFDQVDCGGIEIRFIICWQDYFYDI